MKKRNVLILALMALVVFAAVGGCSAARRPAPPGQTPQNPNAALPADPRESNALAKRLAAKAADVPGVKDAVVVLFGTNAYVGLNMEPNQEGRTKEVEREAAMRVKRADNRIRRVLVTSDPDLVTRLDKIARGIARGRPASAFVDEFSTLNKRMTPVTK